MPYLEPKFFENIDSAQARGSLAPWQTAVGHPLLSCSHINFTSYTEFWIIQCVSHDFYWFGIPRIIINNYNRFWLSKG